METLRDLPELEALEDAGLLGRQDEASELPLGVADQADYDAQQFEGFEEL